MAGAFLSRLEQAEAARLMFSAARLLAQYIEYHQPNCSGYSKIPINRTNLYQSIRA
jgi:hypothetical protein